MADAWPKPVPEQKGEYMNHDLIALAILTVVSLVTGGVFGLYIGIRIKGTNV